MLFSLTWECHMVLGRPNVENCKHGMEACKCWPTTTRGQTQREQCVNGIGFIFWNAAEKPVRSKYFNAIFCSFNRGHWLMFAMFCHVAKTFTACRPQLQAMPFTSMFLRPTLGTSSDLAAEVSFRRCMIFRAWLFLMLETDMLNAGTWEVRVFTSTWHHEASWEKKTRLEQGIVAESWQLNKFDTMDRDAIKIWHFGIGWLNVKITELCWPRATLNSFVFSCSIKPKKQINICCSRGDMLSITPSRKFHGFMIFMLNLS